MAGLRWYAEYRHSPAPLVICAVIDGTELYLCLAAFVLADWNWNVLYQFGLTSSSDEHGFWHPNCNWVGQKPCSSHEDVRPNW